MRSRLPRFRPPHRGVTLIEMLVTVTLLVLMMTALTQIFTAATGSVSAARAYQGLDDQLRQLFATIRTDLQGVHAKMTPPIDPNDNEVREGYFEYSEGQFADIQNEDTDDIVRFTADAPEGQFFTGRVYTNPAGTLSKATLPAYLAQQPITITSQTAEIIYFLRNGNLYRRVFLVVPDRQNSIILNGVDLNGNAVLLSFYTNQFGHVSWLGVNDVSARPPLVTGGVPILNSLKDLANRENRAFYPRYSNDYHTIGTGKGPPDGAPDEDLGLGVPDWSPVLYGGLFSTALVNQGPSYAKPTSPTSATADLAAFPYLYMGAYSKAAYTLDTTNEATKYGPLHGMPLKSYATSTTVNGPPTMLPYGYVYSSATSFVQAATQVNRPNHAPLEAGDLLNNLTGNASSLQTWWGLPTWRETMNPNWTDPAYSIAGYDTQVPCLAYSFLLGGSSTHLLPPLDGTYGPVSYQPYNDGAGTAYFAWPNYAVFEDDLLMTGVRSFDVKAYDDAAGQYVDLGYSGLLGGAGSLSVAHTVLQTFGHEGRIPPLTTDFRADAQYPALSPNIGDNNVLPVRLRRVFDTWSTDYTDVAASGVDSNSGSLIGPPFGTASGYPFPIYPSYPPPYPIPMRGIQIQIRVVDPRNEHIKVLTIRQDFTDKL